MNKKLFSIAAVLIMSAALFSCKDDDKGPSSSFTYDGKTYALSTGYRYEFGETATSGVYEHDIILYSKAITASNLSDPFDFIDCTVYSSSETSLPDGTYTVGTAEEALTLGSGSVNIGVSIAGAGSSYDVVSGTIVVSNSGKKFVFDLIVDGSKAVTGTFNGALTVQ